jgi:hypothetical protein
VQAKEAEQQRAWPFLRGAYLLHLQLDLSPLFDLGQGVTGSGEGSRRRTVKSALQLLGERLK